MVYEGPRHIVIEEAHDLPLGEGQVRIETMYTGISHGTEMAVYRGTAPFFSRKKDASGLFVEADSTELWSYPVRSSDSGVWYMGYAAVGRVVETGPGVKTLQPGDIVYCNTPHQSQTVKPENQAVKLPVGLKPEYGIFFTNLMTAYNAILDANIKLGDIMVVSGLGVLGQLAAQMCRMSGASAVYGVDLLEKRGQAALENGLTAAFSPLSTPEVAREIRKLTNGRGADGVIEVSGNVQALQEAIRIAARDTTVTAVGWYQGFCHSLNLAEEFHHNRITIRSSQTGGINPEIRHMWNHQRKEAACLELLSRLKLDNLITTVIPYGEIARAYEEIDRNPGDIIQVVLKY
ncbi:MAG: adh 4 [Paenibacillaceae bacterium]|nr:adh 4 [Paenibacillaceae bacterium]